MAKAVAKKSVRTEIKDTASKVSGFRLSPDMQAEWDAWEQLATAEGLSRRDWVFQRVRQTLVPKPRPIESPLASKRYGMAVGLMAGRLDAIFQHEAEADEDRGWIVAWALKHPEMVSDVVQWLTAQEYGLRFRGWWQSEIRSFLDV